MPDDTFPELQETWFWDVIDQAARDRRKLVPILQHMSREELIAFDHAFQRATHALFRSPYVDQIQQDGTEDNLHDTLEWVVSQGRDYYFAVLSDPGRMPHEYVAHQAPDTFTGLAAYIFLDRFGELLPPPSWSS